MLGLEGLPLKYILIIVVAGLILAAVVAFISGLTTQLTSSGSQVTSTLNQTTGASSQDICESTSCCWKNGACNCTLKTDCSTLR